MNNVPVPDNSAITPKKPSKLGSALFWLSLVVGLFYFMNFLNDRTTADRNEKAAQQAEFQACVDRGVAYFKEMGSYPYLQSDGRKADVVADERCRRTLTAF